MDFQRATQAYIWALPAVGFHALHLAHLKNFDAPNGAVVLFKDLADKKKDVYDDDEECECGDCNPEQQINA
jgi:hypothetical protein